MPKLTIKRINRELQEQGLPFEIVKGEGYHYFVTLSTEKYDTRSVMVPRLNSLPLASWLYEAEIFDQTRVR